MGWYERGKTSCFHSGVCLYKIPFSRCNRSHLQRSLQADPLSILLIFSVGLRLDSLSLMSSFIVGSSLCTCTRSSGLTSWSGAPGCNMTSREEAQRTATQATSFCWATCATSHAVLTTSCDSSSVHTDVKLFMSRGKRTVCRHLCLFFLVCT